MLPTPMIRRALLVFADDARLDLARRRLPLAALPLLHTPALHEVDLSGVDVHLFDSRQQRGNSFAARFENAIETLSALGYEEIVAIGRDCPGLSGGDIAQAFTQLRGQRLVLGPDHRGGCYLIAFRAADRALFRGIRWQRNTDCAQLQERVGTTGVALLPVKQDIDSWGDLRLAARSDAGIARLVASVLDCASAVAGEAVCFVNAAVTFVRLHGQIPPPAVVV